MLAALGYVENWWLIHTNQAYGAIFSEGSPVQHFWSLAIEEQYYLFFPLLMVGLFRVRAAEPADRRGARRADRGELRRTRRRSAATSTARTTTRSAAASEILVGIVAAFLVAQFDRERNATARGT